MKIVTAMLLASTVSAGTSLRHLAGKVKVKAKEGSKDWVPDVCRPDGVQCTLQDDGYWFEDKDGNWEHYEYSKRKKDGAGGYEVQDRNGKWKFVKFTKRAGDGGYWIDDMEGQWKFVPYAKRHDEGGFGYWIQDIKGEWTFIEYQKRRTKDGVYVTQLNGKEVFYPNPKPKKKKKDGKKFNADKANQEAINDAARKAEAELAGKIIGVAEKGKKKRKDKKKRDVDMSQKGKKMMSEKEAQEYYINEKVRIGDYSFDIKLKSAVKVVASTMALATYLSVNL